MPARRRRSGLGRHDVSEPSAAGAGPARPDTSADVAQMTSLPVKMDFGTRAMARATIPSRSSSARRVSARSLSAIPRAPSGASLAADRAPRANHAQWLLFVQRRHKRRPLRQNARLNPNHRPSSRPMVPTVPHLSGLNKPPDLPVSGGRRREIGGIGFGNARVRSPQFFAICALTPPEASRGSRRRRLQRRASHPRPCRARARARWRGRGRRRHRAGRWRRVRTGVTSDLAECRGRCL